MLIPRPPLPRRNPLRAVARIRRQTARPRIRLRLLSIEPRDGGIIVRAAVIRVAVSTVKIAITVSITRHWGSMAWGAFAGDEGCGGVDGRVRGLIPIHVSVGGRSGGREGDACRVALGHGGRGDGVAVVVEVAGFHAHVAAGGDSESVELGVKVRLGFDEGAAVVAHRLVACVWILGENGNHCCDEDVQEEDSGENDVDEEVRYAHDSGNNALVIVRE